MAVNNNCGNYVLFEETIPIKLPQEGKEGKHCSGLRPPGPAPCLLYSVLFTISDTDWLLLTSNSGLSLRLRYHFLYWKLVG